MTERYIAVVEVVRHLNDLLRLERASVQRLFEFAVPATHRRTRSFVVTREGKKGKKISAMFGILGLINGMFERKYGRPAVAMIVDDKGRIVEFRDFTKVRSLGKK